MKIQDIAHLRMTPFWEKIAPYFCRPDGEHIRSAYKHKYSRIGWFMAAGLGAFAGLGYAMTLGFGVIGITWSVWAGAYILGWSGSALGKEFGNAKFSKAASALAFYRGAVGRYLRQYEKDWRSLEAKVNEFNAAIDTQKRVAESLSKSDSEVQDANVQFWSERRAEIERLMDIQMKRVDFAVEAEKLGELEAGLAKYDDGGKFGATQDVAPYVAAARFRQTLEDQLPELGLPFDFLPPPPEIAKRLKAASK